MKILFSPIGTSDPIRDNYDGPWLHCCRNEQPDLTVIYMTATIANYHEKDDRYKKTLQLLAEHLHKEIEIRTEIHPEITDPQKQNSFDHDFCGILKKLHNEFPDAEILVNCSSGTPTMKTSAADSVLMVDFPVRRLQVDSPEETIGKNNEGRVGADYDTLTEWECNLNNETNTILRMHPWDARDIFYRPQCNCRSVSICNNYTLQRGYSNRH